MDRIVRILAIAAACSVLAVPIAAQEIDDGSLLAAFDAATGLDADVTGLTVRIVSETADGTRDATVRLQFRSTDAGSSARIEFLTPDELAGQIYLSTPDGTFFFGPDLDFPIRTSATAQIFGDAAVAQTSGIAFSSDYRIADRRSVVGDDGALLLQVDLVAKDPAVAFQEITVTADPDSLRPISAVLHAISGLPLYDLSYLEYAVRGGSDVYVRRQEIVNRLLVGNRTRSEILEISTDEIPASQFDPDALGAS